jgi:RHS repeat-associated protein
MSRPRHFLLVCIVWSLALFVPTSRAQLPIVTNTTSTPIPGAGHDYLNGPTETVNPSNGSLSIRVPVIVPPSRGFSLPFSFAYDSNGVNYLAYNSGGYGSQFWQTPSLSTLSNPWTEGGWSETLPTISDVLLSWTATSPPPGDAAPSASPLITQPCYALIDFVFQDASGNRHNLGLTNYSNPGGTSPCNTQTQDYPKGFSEEIVLQGGEGSISASIPSAWSAGEAPNVVDGDGVLYDFPNSGGNASWIASGVADRNGNYVTINSSFPTFNYVDTAGRTVLQDSGFGKSPETLTVSGLGEPYTLTWTTLSTPTFTTQITTTYGTCTSPTHDNWGTTTRAISSLTLPNGESFTYSYDPVSGLVNKITYPTGGYVSYVWGMNVNAEQTMEINSSGNETCGMQYAVPAITDRYVSFDGTHQAEHQHFAYSTTWSSGSGPWTSKKTTVTTYDLVRNTSYQTVYNYSYVYDPWQPNAHVGIQPQIPVESSVAYYDTNGSLLETVSKAWKNKRLLSAQQTAYANGQSSLAVYCFNSNEEPTETDNYDFGTATPTLPACNPAVPPGATSGGFLRKAVTNYAPNAAMTTAHVIDEPSSVVVYSDLAGTNRVAETDDTYDTPAGTVTSGIVQHNTGCNCGNLTTQSQWLNTTGGSLSTNFTNDNTGQRLTMTDPNLNTTTYSYSDSYSSGTPPGPTNAYLTTLTLPPTPNANHIEKFSYAYASGEVTSSTDQNNQVTSYKYVDSLARLTETDYPDSGKTTMTYNDASYNPSTPSPSVTTTRAITSSTNLISVSAMDGLGHTVETELTSDPDGTDYTVTTLDGLGRPLYSYNPTRCSTPTTNCGESTWGYTTTIYDASGRTTSVTAQDGSVTTNSYSGNCATVTDPASKKRAACADGLGRLTQVTEDPGGLGYVTTYSHDALGDLTNVVQNGSRQRSFTYNSLSQLTQAINPESGTVNYTYDANSNLQTKKDARNITTTYTYDALNRLTQKSYSDGTTPLVGFYYDNASCCPYFSPALQNTVGRLVYSTVSGKDINYFSYDPIGRTTYTYQAPPSIYGTSSYPVAYTYDLAGDMTSYTNGFGITLTQIFDTATRATQLTSSWVDSQHPATLITVDPASGYFPNGALRKATYGNGLMESSVLNSRFQPCRHNVNWSSTALSTCTTAIPPDNLVDFNYGFNAGTTDNGNVASMTAAGAQTFNRTYTYDSLNRLSTLSSPSDPNGCNGLSWSYDPWGNRTAQTTTSGSCFQQPLTTFNTNNQFPTTYLYDAAGNMTYDGTHAYTYDAENRLAQVDGGSTATYTYDANGGRVERATSGGKLDYVYDLSGNVVAEYDTSTGYTGWLTGYVYFNGSLASEYYGGTTYFAHQDHLGSTRLMTSLNQSVSQNLDYLPYGELNSADTGIDTHKFTGKERDAESGLDNFGARYNSSQYGRFMSPDPVFISADRIRDPQSLNLYAYVRNNPLSLTDDSGLDFYLACATSDHSGCGQVQNGSDKVWVQGQTVNGSFQATDVDMNKQGDTSAGYHDQFGNQYTGTFDAQNGVSFTNTSTGDTSGHSRFIDGSDETDVNGSGAVFSGIEGKFFSDCGGSCEGRASLYETSPGAFANAEAALHKQSGFMSALDLLSGAHKPGSQWKDSSGYVHMLNPSGQMEMHFEGHPTGVDVTNFVLHMVDTIRDAASGRAAAEKNTPLP